jgi:hypothetical protein
MIRGTIYFRVRFHAVSRCALKFIPAAFLFDCFSLKKEYHKNTCLNSRGTVPVPFLSCPIPFPIIPDFLSLFFITPYAIVLFYKLI